MSKYIKTNNCLGKSYYKDGSIFSLELMSKSLSCMLDESTGALRPSLSAYLWQGIWSEPEETYFIQVMCEGGNNKNFKKQQLNCIKHFTYQKLYTNCFVFCVLSNFKNEIDAHYYYSSTAEELETLWRLASCPNYYNSYNLELRFEPRCP